MGQKAPFLIFMETERLVLRSVLESDDKALYEYMSDPVVGVNAGWAPHESLEETRGIMRAVFLNNPFVFAVVLKSTGSVIGTVGFTQNDGKKFIGYSLKKSFWGRGLMTEAVSKLLEFAKRRGITQVYADVYDYNMRSVKVLIKNGFIKVPNGEFEETRFDGAKIKTELYYKKL